MSPWLAQAVTLSALLSTWAFWAVACVGLGAPLCQIFSVNPARPRNIAFAFWVGLSVIIATLQLWHLFAPINITATLTLLVAGLPWGIATTLRLIQHCRQFSRRAWLLFIACTLPLLLWLANRAAGPEFFYDAGLYHHQLLQWIEHYPIVPGLANLHFRLGFNSGITLLAAAFDQPPWRGQSNHLVNGFFLTAFALQLMHAAARILGRRSTELADWFTLFLSLPLFDWAMDVQASSLSADLAAAIISLASGIAFIAFHTERDDLPRRALLATTTVTLSALAISCKGSCVPLSGLLIFLTFWEAARNHPRYAMVITSAVALLLLPGLWIINNIIATGYPLFPSESFALPVDWQLPSEQVRWLRLVIRDWNRWDSYDTTAGHWRWLQPWFVHHILTPDTLFKALIPLAVGLIAFAFLPYQRIKIRRYIPYPQNRQALTVLLAATLIAAAIWFNTGPAPRFAAHIFQLFLAVALCFLFQPLLQFPRPRRAALTLIALLALAPPVTMMFFQTLWILPPPNASPASFASALHPIPFDPPDLETRSTITGLQLHIPTAGDRAWNAPIPSTPDAVFNPNLRLRGPTLSSGFTTKPLP